MATSSLHKLVFALTPGELDKVLRKEARTGWYPSKFEPQPIKDGLLVVLEKTAMERAPQRARAS